MKRPPAPYGLFRVDGAGGSGTYARVRFNTGDLDVPEALYRAEKLLPDFDALPTRAEHDAAKRER